MKPLIGLLALLLAVPALADIIHLNDGTTLQGDIKRTADGWLVTDATGKVTAIPAADVKSIELKKAASPEGAEQQLASLRRSVANLDDVKRILERYQSFIKQNAGSAAAADARKDLAQWQDRLNRKLVKAGEQWVTPDEFNQLSEKSAQAADAVRPLVAAGKITEAMGAVDKALAITPKSPQLVYLKGVLLMRQGQLVPARNTFQSVEALLPDNAAAHNNIAVILWKTHAQMPALAEYDKAMIADPGNRTILDNVSEALHALPESYHKNSLTRRVVEHFNEQDAGLQKQMAGKGLYRWGAQWLNKDEYAQLEAARKAVQEKLDALKKDFDDNQARILRINTDITSDQQLMAQMQQESYQQDASGHVVFFPLPQRYYDLQKDVLSLQAERTAKQGQQVELQRLYAERQKELPAQRYTGMQKPFDVEGMPAPATQPATRPAGDW